MIWVAVCLLQLLSRMPRKTSQKRHFFHSNSIKVKKSHKKWKKVKKSEEKWLFEFGNPTDLNPSVLALEISFVNIYIYTPPRSLTTRPWKSTETQRKGDRLPFPSFFRGKLTVKLWGCIYWSKNDGSDRMCGQTLHGSQRPETASLSKEQENTFS